MASNNLPTDPVMPSIPKLGYCDGVGSDGMSCFVRDHCMHHTTPALDKRTIDAPFRWWLSDHNQWSMECSEYVADALKRPAADVPAKACLPDDHMYSAVAGSEIGTGVCVFCGAPEPALDVTPNQDGHRSDEPSSQGGLGTTAEAPSSPQSSGTRRGE